MKRWNWTVIGTLAATCMLGGCSGVGDGTPVLAGGDDFARGTQALALLDAPSWLCDGHGALRECAEGSSCTSSRGVATDSPLVTAGASGAGGTQAPQNAALPGPPCE